MKRILVGVAAATLALSACGNDAPETEAAPAPAATTTTAEVAPTTEAPAEVAPTTEAPAEAEATTEEPTVAAPAPTTEEPTEEPTVAAPAPTTEEPTEEPTVAAPAPTTEEPTEEPVEETTEEPTEEAAEETSAAPAESGENGFPNDATMDDIDFGESATNDRGNLVKEIGQWAGIGGIDDDLPHVIWRVTDIETDYQCASSMPEPADNGQFLALHVEVQTFPALAESEWNTNFNMSNYDFTLFGPDGQRENDSDGQSMWCADMGEQLPSTLGPSERASGVIVFDTALDTGSAVFTSYLGDGAEGSWAYDF